MAYALLTEGMNVETRQSFDRMIAAKPEESVSRENVPVAESAVVAQNREFVKALGVPIRVVKGGDRA